MDMLQVHEIRDSVYPKASDLVMKLNKIEMEMVPRIVNKLVMLAGRGKEKEEEGKQQSTSGSMVMELVGEKKK